MYNKIVSDVYVRQGRTCLNRCNYLKNVASIRWCRKNVRHTYHLSGSEILLLILRCKNTNNYFRNDFPKSDD